MQSGLRVLSLLVRETTWEFSECEVIANSTQMRLCTKWKNKARLGVGRESPFSITRPQDWLSTGLGDNTLLDFSSVVLAGKLGDAALSAPGD